VGALGIAKSAAKTWLVHDDSSRTAVHADCDAPTCALSPGTMSAAVQFTTEWSA
jgi:hypothetical protein